VSFIKAFKIIVLVILSVVMFVVSTAFFVGQGVERTALNRSFYEGLVREKGLAAYVHSEIEKVISDDLVKQIEESLGTGEEMPEFAKEVAVSLTQKVADIFDEQWLADNCLTAIDDVLAVVEGKQQELSASIDMAEQKEELLQFKAQQITKTLNEMGLEIPQEEIGQIAEQFMAEVPDKIYLSELIGEGIPDDVKITFGYIRIARWYFSFLPYIFFTVFLALCLLLAGVFGGMKWFGANLLAPGALFLTGVQVIPRIILKPLLIDIKITEFITLDPDKAFDYAMYTINRFSLVPFIFVIAGIVLIALGIILKNVSAKKKANK